VYLHFLKEERKHLSFYLKPTERILQGQNCTRINLKKSKNKLTQLFDFASSSINETWTQQKKSQSDKLSNPSLRNKIKLENIFKNFTLN
jgi:hypothetical protein